MRAKPMILIVIALICGLVASVGITKVVEESKKRAQTAEVETVQIYVASADIDLNEKLTPEMVRLEDWPKTRVPENSLTDIEQIKERFASTRLFAGEPILANKLIDTLYIDSLKIPQGHRVCSLSVRMDTAVSGLVTPGDRVDILGFFKQGGAVPSTMSKRILSNVRVFAINSETEQGVDQEGKQFHAKTVSVLVHQKNVGRLLLAKQLGILTLTLLRPDEMGSEDDSVHDVYSAEDLFTMPTEHGEASSSDTQVARTDGASDTNRESNAGHTDNQIGNQLITALNEPNGNTLPPADADSVSQGEVKREPEWKTIIMTPEGQKTVVWIEGEETPVDESVLQRNRSSSVVPTSPIDSRPATGAGATNSARPIPGAGESVTTHNAGH